MLMDRICEVLLEIADDLHLKCHIDQWYGPHKILARFTDTDEQTVEIHVIDIFQFDKYRAEKIYGSLIDKLYINKQVIVGWRPISEYSREKYDWVLVKYFDDPLECVPEVAEMRVDGKWYNRTGALIDPNVFDVRYFFDMHQLDKEV